jgi:hypothetical protein
MGLIMSLTVIGMAFKIEKRVDQAGRWADLDHGKGNDENAIVR